MELINYAHVGLNWFADVLAANAMLLLACILIDRCDAMLVKARAPLARPNNRPR